MSQMEIHQIGKSFGGLQVLKNINISVQDGEFLTLVGPSGCGKSTLIRIIAGLEAQSTGSISVNGLPLDHLRPHERKLSMVFQSYALYPHMSVFDNIAVPLTIQHLNLVERVPLLRNLSFRRRRIMADIGQQVEAVADQLQIRPLLHRKPAQLSGGQRQRVALGRAMVRQPNAFLMDEPLSNLDAKLRVHMRSELTDLHKKMGSTFIYVTHDQVEAMTMSTRVAMMGGGQVQQLGTPTELYEKPANLEVARFIGSPTINTTVGTTGQNGRIEVQGIELGIATDLPAGSDVTVGIRPEVLQVIDPHHTTGRPALNAKLHRVENLGAERLYHFDLIGTAASAFTLRTQVPLHGIDPDGHATLSFDPMRCHIFGSDTVRVDHYSTASQARTIA